MLYRLWRNLERSRSVLAAFSGWLPFRLPDLTDPFGGAFGAGALVPRRMPRSTEGADSAGSSEDARARALKRARPLSL